jgi:hypothetical protein
MDFLSTLSILPDMLLLFDVQLLSSNPTATNNVALTKAARAARGGAR